eukprot:jgi/Tetstr1/420869/TSEL_011942.t1
MLARFEDAGVEFTPSTWAVAYADHVARCSGGVSNHAAHEWAAHGLSDICHDVKSALGVGVQILTDPSVLVSLPKGSDGRPADVGLFGYGGIRGNTVAIDTTIAPILGVSSSDPTTALRAAERHKIQNVLFGLDANTYEKGQPGKTQDVAEFGKAFVALGLTSCWGDVPDPANYTTFNTRTFLQPQLNKAVRMAERKTSSLTDRNPKDFILFTKEHFVKEVTIKDNTGAKTYDEEAPFPTLDFPSDHGVVASALRVLMQT